MTTNSCKVCNDFTFTPDDEGKRLIERHFIEKHPELYRKFLEDRHPELVAEWDEYQEVINGSTKA